jgi:hypothetical protein
MQPIAPIVWLATPDVDGWWVVVQPHPGGSAARLVRVEGGVCYAESGDTIGAPPTHAFVDARWCGPVAWPWQDIANLRTPREPIHARRDADPEVRSA